MDDFIRHDQDAAPLRLQERLAIWFGRQNLAMFRRISVFSFSKTLCGHNA